jgi:hypothetical protein
MAEPGAASGTFALLGACGLYCGACPHYRASLPEGRHVLARALRGGRERDGYVCSGCRSQALYVHPGCRSCAIRACAEERGLLHCGLCPDLPCQRLLAFRDDGHPHHLDILEALRELATSDPARWLAGQARRWSCACGAPFSWYEARCARCGQPLDSYGG